MSLFLSLPREIRDQIIDDVLNYRVTPLRHSSAEVQQKLPEASGQSAFPILPPYGVYNAYALLLTNRQVHHETNERLRKVPRVCEVDIHLISDDCLLPTWVFVPCRRDKINTLQITFRTLRKEVPYLRNLHLMFRQGSTNSVQPAPISALMLHILNVCTTASPLTDHNNPKGVEYQVQEVKICMHTPSDVFEDCQCISHSSEFDRKHVGTLPVHARRARPSWRTPEERIFWVRSTTAGIVQDSLSVHEHLVQSWGLACRVPIFVDGEWMCFFQSNLEISRRVQRLKDTVARLSNNARH